jgi:hypothetical protein
MVHLLLFKLIFGLRREKDPLRAFCRFSANLRYFRQFLANLSGLFFPLLKRRFTERVGVTYFSAKGG